MSLDTFWLFVSDRPTKFTDRLGESCGELGQEAGVVVIVGRFKNADELFDKFEADDVNVWVSFCGVFRWWPVCDCVVASGNCEVDLDLKRSFSVFTTANDRLDIEAMWMLVI